MFVKFPENLSLRRHMTVLVVLLVFISGMYSASAQDIETCTTTCFVDALNGSNLNDGDDSTTPLSTIAEAIARIEPGGQINVAAGTYNERLIITKPLTIAGAGAGVTVITGNNLGVPLTIRNAADDVTLQDLTITAGNSDGIKNSSPQLTILRSNINGNTNDGVESTGGNVTLIESTVSGNRFGMFIAQGSSATIERSTITDNTVDGIISSGSVTLVNSTISGNGDDGIQTDNIATIINSTIANNNHGLSQGTFTVRNSLITNNTSMDCINVTALNVSGSNLQTDGSCTGIAQTTPELLQLQPLAANGGLTATHALLQSSSALNLIDVATCTDLQGNTINTDQRGIERPSPENGNCDVGAFEFHFSSITIAVDAMPTIPTRDFPFTGTLDDFTLYGSNADSDNQPSSISFDLLTAGSYDITQLTPSNWIIDRVECVAEGGSTFGGGGAEISITLLEGDHITCTYFNLRLGQVRILKIDDTNENGSVDDGEAPVEGWQMFLFRQQPDESFAQIQPREVRTGSNGLTSYNGLLPGVYRVCEEQRPGWTNTQLGAEAFLYNGLVCQDFSVDYAENPLITFTNTDDPGTITVFKYEDLDLDGNFDSASESGLTNWQFTLYATDSTLLDTQATAANGILNFNGLSGGDYFVCETLPEGWVNTDIEDTIYVDSSTACKEVTVQPDETTFVNFGNILLNAQATTCNAVSVIDFTQGNDASGNDIAGLRSNPNEALGRPENNDTFNFVSLGFGGELILRLDGIVTDSIGTDLYIVETTFGEENIAEPETVRVYGALLPNDSQWVDLGTLTFDGAIDFSGRINEVLFIRLVDESNPDAFASSVADGYDVDGVACTRPNGIPVAMNDSVEMVYNTNRLINVVANDVDPESVLLFITEVDAAAEGTTEIAGNVVNYTHTGDISPGATESDSFDYTMTDGESSDSATVNVTIGRLAVMPVCSVLTADTITWQVTNPLSTPVDFLWSNGNVDTVNLTGGFGTALPGSSTFTTPRFGNEDSVSLVVGQADQHSATLMPCTMSGDVTIVKLIDWAGETPNNAENFEICINGDSLDAPLCQRAEFPDYTVSFNDLQTGEYTYTETDPGAAWTVSYPGGNTFVLGAGEEATRYVQNTRNPGGIRVTKIVDWNGNPVDNSASFTICVDGAGLANAQCSSIGATGGDLFFGGLPAGNYSVYELFPGDVWSVSGGGTVSVTGGSTSFAPAITNRHADAPPPVCTGVGAQNDISASLTIENGQGVGRVTNVGTTTCTFPIGLASYSMFDNNIDTQVIFASDVPAGGITLAPGQTATLTVALPACASQVDLFYGDLITPMFNGNRYGPRLYAALINDGGNFCPVP